MDTLPNKTPARSNEDLAALVKRAKPGASAITVRVCQVHEGLWRAEFSADRGAVRIGTSMPASTEDGAREALARDLLEDIGETP